MAYFAVHRRSLGQMRTMRDGGGPDFEDWLRWQLTHTLSPERGPRPRPAEARYAVASRTAGPWLTAVPPTRARQASSKAGQASSLHALRAGAVAVAAVAALVAGGATAAIAATGSVSPMSWGQRVVQAVQQCKEQVRGTEGPSQGDAHPGSGGCGSAGARQHGEAKRDQRAGTSGGVSPTARPSLSPSPGKHGQAGTNGNGNQGNGKALGQSKGNGNGAAHGNGSSGHPTPAAADSQ